MILLACPLMHAFMHRSHGGHGDRQSYGGHGCCGGARLEPVPSRVTRPPQIEDKRGD